jgi:hypothetical protein
MQDASERFAVFRYVEIPKFRIVRDVISRHTGLSLYDCDLV